MAKTDIEIAKTQLVGSWDALGLASKENTLVTVYSDSRDFMKTGTENAATNVAETIMYSVRKKSRLREFTFATSTTVANDASDFVVFTITKRTAGGAAVTIATYNTATGANGAITANVPASFTVISNSDSTLAAGDTVHYAIGKLSSGKAVAIGTFTADFEKV